MKKLILLLGLLACSGEQKQPAPAPAAAEQPPPESGGEEMSSGRPAGPVTAPPDGGAYSYEACVKECVRNHQMQAIPIEQIEANCQGECAADKDK
jgi:hypothetical protein